MTVDTQRTRPRSVQRQAGESFGPILKRLRTALGLGSRELSREAGLAPGVVSLYEKGLRTPRADAMTRLADVLGVPVGLLWWFACPQDTSEAPPDVFQRADAMMRGQVEFYTDVLRTRAKHGTR